MNEIHLLASSNMNKIFNDRINISVAESSAVISVLWEKASQQVTFDILN